jgi:hypothetical protein
MRSNKTGARAIQAPLDDVDEIKTRTQHTRDLFAWLNQVKADGDLPPSAFKVAFEIGQHVNRKSGEAFPSSDRIAARISMSQATVIAMVRQLQTNGHLSVDPGRAGRGHSNHYRMILKPQQPEVLEAPKIDTAKPQPAEPQPAKIKPQPADMNHFINNLMNNQEGGLRPPPSLIESVTPIETSIADTPPFPVNTTTVAVAVLLPPTKRETPKGARLDRNLSNRCPTETPPLEAAFFYMRPDAEIGNAGQLDHRQDGHAARRPDEIQPNKKPEELTMTKINLPPRPSMRQITANATGGPRDQAFAALWRAYPEYPRDCSDEDCRELFENALDNGANPDVLIAAAAEYAKRCDGNGDKPQFLCFWLRVRCWEPDKRHLADRPAASIRPRFGEVRPKLSLPPLQAAFYTGRAGNGGDHHAEN